MGIVLRFQRHALASTGERAGLGTSAGQGASGQLSENHCNVRSRRRVEISAPSTIAPSFLPSRKASELTVESFNCRPSAYARATAKSWSISDMPPVSVKLPAMSTAVLPRTPERGFGYPTEMELRDILTWIDQQLEARGISATEAERQAGHPYMIQNMRKTLRNGHGSVPKTQSLAKLAKVLGNAPPGLLEPIEGFHLPAPPRELSDLELLEQQLADIDRQRERIIEAISLIKAARKSG